MDRWEGKVAVVTGVSSGIGESTARLLVKKGMKVAGLVRRFDRVKKLEDSLNGSSKGELKAFDVCDAKKVPAFLNGSKRTGDLFSLTTLLLLNPMYSQITELTVQATGETLAENKG